MSLTVDDIRTLRRFVELVASDGSLLEKPELGFFKIWLQRQRLARASSVVKSPGPSTIQENLQKSLELHRPSLTAPEDNHSDSELQPDNADAEYELPVIDWTTNYSSLPKPNQRDRDLANTKSENAMRAQQNGNFSTAIQLWAEAIRLNVTSWLFYARRAQCLLEIGRWPAAVRHCDVSLWMNWNSALAWRVRGFAYKELGCLTCAYRDLQKSLQLEDLKSTRDVLTEVERRHTERKLEKIEQDAPALETILPKNELKRLSTVETKRQNAIVELVHSQRNHVRRLFILQQLFATPLEQVYPVTKGLSKGLPSSIKAHSKFLEFLDSLKIESKPYGLIGRQLHKWLGGPHGTALCKAYCEALRDRNNLTTLLRQQRDTDPSFNNRLADIESEPVCSKQGFFSLLRTDFEMLTRLPICIETIRNHCKKNSDEANFLEKSHLIAKEFAWMVNDSVLQQENAREMRKICRRLRVASTPLVVGYEELERKWCSEQLLYHGQLTWLLSAGDERNSATSSSIGRPLPVKAVLCSSHLVLLEEACTSNGLTSRDDSLLLRYQGSAEKTARSAGKLSDRRVAHSRSPVIPLCVGKWQVSENASESKELFLFNAAERTSPSWYQLRADSQTKRDRWAQLIRCVITQKLESVHRMAGSSLPIVKKN